MSPEIMGQRGIIKGALCRQGSALIVLIFSLLFAICSSHAADNTSKERSVDQTNAKKLALIHLLARAGRSEQAARKMRLLYPLGPPNNKAALEYYQIIGNTSNGWNEAKTGLEKLVKAKPNDLRYTLALAQHLITRATTRRSGILTLATLANVKQSDDDRQQILMAWMSALITLEHDPDNINLYQEYLLVDPANTKVSNALSAAQRIQADRQPWLLRDQADAQLQAGHPEAAIEHLKHAMGLAPANPWVRFDLARIYHKRGRTDQGRALINKGLTVAPDDPDMLYASALYFSLLDKADNALLLLDKIPAAARTPSMLRLQQRMSIQSKVNQAKNLQIDNRQSDAFEMLSRAETEAGKDAELVGDVANAWLASGETSRAIALMHALLNQQPVPGIDLKLRYATLLNRAEQDEELTHFLSQLNSTKKLSTANKAQLSFVRTSLAARQTDKLRNAGDYVKASAILASALQLDPGNIDLLMAQARIHITTQQPEQARVIYQKILEGSPQDTDVRLSLASAMNEMGDFTAARLEIETLLASTAGNDIDARLQIADWYIGANNISSARQIVGSLQQHHPNDLRILKLSGRIERAAGHDYAAMDYFKQAKANEEISRMERSRTAYVVSAGIDYLSKTDGAPGISNLTLVELPVEIRFPVGYSGDSGFVQIDSVSANAGNLSLNDLYNLRQYGKVLALSPGGITSNPNQSAQGTAFAVGYETSNIRMDIGTTPLGFPVSDVVGGFKMYHSAAPYDYSVSLSRRPVTSTLLSFAGAHDPVTGETWGGVRSTGFNAHIGYGKGRFSVFGDFGYYLLSGKNVADNSELALRTGFDYDLIEHEDMRLSAGLALTNWQYRENLRYYTFGHGGYYSPQNYYSLATPVRWTGRKNGWSYLLNGSVSISTSQEKDMPFYPTDTALQILGNTNAAIMNPYYIGGDGNGTGFSISGAIERKLTAHLFVGGRLGIDRSEFYTPDFAIFYLRYLFDTHTGPAPYPPDPIKPYSQF